MTGAVSTTSGRAFRIYAESRVLSSRCRRKISCSKKMRPFSMPTCNSIRRCAISASNSASNWRIFSIKSLIWAVIWQLPVGWRAIARRLRRKPAVNVKSPPRRQQKQCFQHRAARAEIVAVERREGAAPLFYQGLKCSAQFMLHRTIESVILRRFVAKASARELKSSRRGRSLFAADAVCQREKIT